MRNLFHAGEAARLTRAHQRARNVERRYLPAAATANGTDFGTPSYEVPLFAVEQTVGSFVSASVGWVFDNAASRGGYVTHTAPALNDYFGFMVPFHPKGGLFAIYYTAFGGTDYGKISVDIASLSYQSASRTSGDPAGKINGLDAPYDSVTWKNLIIDDWYSAIALNESDRGGILTFIPGGNEGDPLTSLTAGGTDPYTGFSISDGGPGWYGIRFKVTSKNASSTNYRMKVASAAVLRMNDGEGL